MMDAGAMPAKTQTKRKRREARETTRQLEHVPVEDLDVVLLQMAARGGFSLQDIVFHLFSSEAYRLPAGAQWFAFQGTDRPHVSGRSSWIGLSTSVPVAVVDLIEAAMCLSYGRVEREMGRALHLGLQPFARLSGDGLELLVPAALLGDPSQRRVVARSGVEVITRGYTVAPRKAAQSRQLFFG